MKKMNMALETALKLVEMMFALLVGRRVNINGENFPVGKLAKEAVGHLDPVTKADLVKQANRYGWFDRFFFDLVPDEIDDRTPLLYGMDGSSEEMVETLLWGLITEALWLTVRHKYLKYPEPVNIARTGERPLLCVPGNYVTLTESWLAENREWFLKRMRHYMSEIWKNPSCEFVCNERIPKSFEAEYPDKYPGVYPKALLWWIGARDEIDPI